jgi:hypothetical protein
MQQIWVTSLLPINPAQCFAFDRLGNILFFERNKKPSNDIEKMRMDIVACTRSNEEITRAVIGDLNIQKLSTFSDS